jgi:hypothetical protein
MFTVVDWHDGSVRKVYATKEKMRSGAMELLFLQWNNIDKWHWMFARNFKSLEELQ